VLPREVQDHVSLYILVKKSSVLVPYTWQPDGLRHTSRTSDRKGVLAVLRLNKQVNIEAREILHGEHEFENYHVRIFRIHFKNEENNRISNKGGLTFFNGIRAHNAVLIRHFTTGGPFTIMKSSQDHWKCGVLVDFLCRVLPALTKLTLTTKTATLLSDPS
jgi:hypothetical protein